MLAIFTQLMCLSICFVCRNRKFVSSTHDVYLNQITNRRKQFKTTSSLQSSHSSTHHQGLPNQMNNYFNRVD